MVSPNPSSAQYRPDLRGAVAEEWDASGEVDYYIADKVLPMADVPHAAGTYRRIPRENYLKNVNDARAADGTYEQGEFNDEEAAFVTQERGFEIPVDANANAQAAIYFDAERAASRMVLSTLYRQHEKRVAAKLFNATTFSGLTDDVGTEWSTAASATPITDVKEKAEVVRQNCGMKPNTLVISAAVAVNLSECSQVLNRMNGGATVNTPAKATMAVIAQLMEIDRIVVGGGLKNTANEAKDASLADIWDDEYALLCYVNPNPSLFSAQLGATWHWGGDGSQKDFLLESYFSEPHRSNVIRGRRQVGPDVQYPEFGYLLGNITVDP